MYNDETFPYNYITTENLMKILQDLPKDALLVPNDCYNINVYTKDDWLGTIELGSETFTVWEPEEF